MFLRNVSDYFKAENVVILTLIPQIRRPFVKNKTYYIASEKGDKIQNEWYQISQSIKIMHCFSRE